VVLALLPFLAGCSSNNKGKIEGTKWTSQAATVKGKSIPAGVLQLEFKKDMSLVYRAGTQTFTGTYSLGGGDSVTLHLNQELQGRKTHTEKVSISGNQLTMTDSDGTALGFSKAN
jgi:hypothetical protein